MNEKGLLKDAMQAKTEGNVENAIELLSQLINEFPNSAEAETARAIRYNLKESDIQIERSDKGDLNPALLVTKLFHQTTPSLSIVFFVLAAFSFLGGIILTTNFWPGDPGYGREWKTEAYTLSIIWFTAGLVEAAVFSAIGQGLSYLHKIVENTSKE